MAEADGPPTPLVSVIIPVHNAAAYLQQCLDSVLNQTLREHRGDRGGRRLHRRQPDAAGRNPGAGRPRAGR